MKKCLLGEVGSPPCAYACPEGSNGSTEDKGEGEEGEKVSRASIQGGGEAQKSVDTHLQAALLHLNVPLIVTDLTGHILKANEAVCRLTEYDSLIGRHIEILMPTTIAEKHAMYMRRFVETGESTIIGGPGREVLMKTRSGRYVPVVLTVAVCNSGFVGVLVTIPDKSIANIQSRAHQKWRRFITYLSHEVRVPLGSLKLELGEMTTRLPPPIQENMLMTKDMIQWISDQRTAIHDMQSAILGMERLLNDVLDQERMRDSAFTYTYTGCDLREPLTSVTRRFSIVALKEKKADVNVCVELGDVDHKLIWCAGDRLMQVVQNLLSNAVRHVNMEGMIIVALKCSSGTRSCVTSSSSPSPDAKDSDLRYFYGPPESAIPEYLTLSVHNTGSYISPSAIANLFAPFKHVESQTSGVPDIDWNARGRSGLGLWICNNIVETGHRGAIKVTSDEKGTLFEAVMPVFTVQIDVSVNKGIGEHEATGPEEDEEMASVQERGKGDALESTAVDILIAEDSVPTQKILKRILEREGYTINQVYDGKAGLQWLQEGHQCKIVLSDRRMPVMNGAEMTRAIRKIHPQLYIVGCTGDAMEETLQEFRDSGCNEVVVKPVGRATLLTLVKRGLVHYDSLH